MTTTFMIMMIAATALLVTATAVTSTSTTFVMMLTVVAAIGAGAEVQAAVQQGSYCCIGIAGYTGKQANACLSQGHLSTAANAAADQCVCIDGIQDTGQCAVTLSVGVDHFCAYHFVIFDGVYFKLFGVSEMLENLSVIVGNCNFHSVFLLLYVDFIV